MDAPTSSALTLLTSNVVNASLTFSESLPESASATSFEMTFQSVTLVLAMKYFWYAVRWGVGVDVREDRA